MLDMLALIIPKQATIARRLGVKPTCLSLYRSGRRAPRPDRLREMYGAACREIGAERMPVTLDELEQLRSIAHKRGGDVSAASNIARSAASSPVPARDGPPGTLPASRPAGDRRNESISAAVSTAEELLSAHAAGDRRGVLEIAWSISRTMAAAEFAAVVAELHALERSDLVEAVLLGGRERSKDEAMIISLELMARGFIADAELVMRAAIALPGPPGSRKGQEW